MLVTVSFSLNRFVLATLSGLLRGKTKIVEMLSGLLTRNLINGRNQSDSITIRTATMACPY